MLLKWNERIVRDLDWSRTTVTVPVEGKLIPGVAKRALYDRLRREGYSPYHIVRVGKGAVKVYVTAPAPAGSGQTEIPIGLLDDFADAGL